ncbi:MAG: radical SAM protein [SAR324 cluster bacterium]|nr:radical SAM protein [SAR324 cluster bacterium]
MTAIVHIAENSILDVTSHERLSSQGLLIYPVVSRRSGGVSIGINLNPDKICNFHCVYCQVNRNRPETVPVPSVRLILEQLKQFFIKIQESGGYWQEVPVCDIALSGDGEPTTFPEFDQLIPGLFELRQQFNLQHIPLVLITNASCLHLSRIQKVLPIFIENGGRIWAKLDAGDEKNWQQLMQTDVPFARILNNLRNTGMKYKILLQSCFMQIHQQEFSPTLLDTYVSTVQSLLNDKTQIQEIQAYTIARPPANSFVRAWDDSVMDEIGKILTRQIPVPVKIYYGRHFD